MAKIVLREYLDQINQFVGEGRYSEATQHCRHILQSYPRHIDTYRALAKSLLEQRQYHDARDVFQRVLSADPSDFIAHAGLAFMNRDEGNLEQAVWHMERAYEVEPHNTAIQEELLDLYRAHYGKRPPKLPLTGAALAWLYFRGELYQLAAAELRKILVDQPERVDLKALLAEVLWRDGQRMDAVNACLQVLDKLPNCIQVNAILAEIWLLTGRIDEAQVYLQRLRDLALVNQADSDPETAVYRAFAAVSTPGLPNTITIEYFNELDESLPGRNGAGAATWLDEADTIAEGEGGEYSWLQDMGAQTDEEVEADQEIAEAEWTAVTGSGLINSDWFAEETPAAPIQPLAQDDMDWLHDLEPDLPDTASPDILADETLAPAAWSPADLPEEPGAVPDWLAGTSDADFEPVHLSAADTAGWLADLTSMAADKPDSDVNIGRTDWFTDHSDDADDADDVTAFDTPLETSLTDWFKESTEELAASGAAALIDADFAEPEAEPEREEENATWSPDDVPAWLMTAPLSTPEAAPAAPRTTTADDAEWGDDLTDWLAETPASDADTSSTDDQELPFGIDLDQLLESPGLTTGLLSDKAEADDLPDWLLSGQSGLEDVLAPEEPDDDLGLDELFGDLGMFLDGKDDESPSAWADDEAYESLEAQLTGDTTSDADDFGAAAWFDDELAADTAVPLDDIHTPDAFMATVDVDAPFEPIVAPTEKGSSLLDRLLHKMPDEMGAMEAAVSGDMDEKENNLDIPDEVTGQEADDQEISLDWLADLDEQAEAADLLATQAAAMTPEAATALPDWLDDLSIDDAPTATTAANKDLTDLLQTHAFVEQPSTAVTDLLDWLDAESSGDEADTTAPVTDEALLAGLDADDVALDDVSLGWLDELSLDGDEADLPPALMGIDEAEDEAPLLDLLAEGADDSLTWLAELEVDDGDLTAVPDQPTADETQTWLDDLVEFAGEEEDLSAPDLAAEVALPTDADRLTIDDFFADVETAAEADEAVMSWLDDLTGAAEEEPVAIAEADEAVMNWLDDLTPQAEEELIATADADEAVMDWLDDLTPQAEEELIATADADEAVMSWLDDLTPQAEEELIATADADEAVMDWLDDLTPQAEEEQVVAALDAAVDWQTDDLFTDAALSDAWLEEEPDALEDDEFERVSLLPELSSPTGDASGDSLSDWLDDFNQDTEEDVLDLDVEEFTLADLLMAADAAGDETISAVDAAAAEPAADAFSWLDDLSEEDAEVEVDGTAVAEPQLEIDWLTEFVEDEIEDVTADEALALDALLPDEAQDLVEMPETFVAEIVAASELPDWFDDLDTEEPDLEVPTLAAPEAEPEPVWSPDIPDMESETALPLAVDVFDDLPALDDDDVMGWLDSLTAAAEAEMEAATLASLDVPAASDVDLAADADEAAEDTPSAALAWLETMAVETDVEPEEPVAELTDAATPEFDSGIIFPEDAMFPRDVGKPTDVPDELDDTMAWIEQLAAEQGVSLDMAVEEPEFLIPEAAETFAAVAPATLPEAEEEAEAVEEIEDPIAWLEQLASQQSTPIEPLPTVADRAMSETVVPPELPMPEITPVIAAAATELPAATTPPTGADSLDDWLAALITEQGVSDEFDVTPTPEPEPPAAAPPVIEPEPEPIPELEVVDEIAADLDWLEMLAAASAAPLVTPLDSAESVAEPAASDLFAALDWVEQQLKQAQPPTPALVTTLVEDIDVSQIPEDPDKTMAWLEQLSDQDEGEVIAAVTAVSPQPPLLTDEEFDGLVSDVPEDPDKNMAWLETLAARQGAPLAELPAQADDATPHEPEPEQPEPPQPPTDALPPSLTTTASAAFSVPEAADLVFPEDAMFPRDV
ncbi:MAG: tetratricopeptide repeat protein, partial [Anaerolinea sp.]|nr:tetratricopeptide repeat protein [Anaerolinea sp.]